jgi:hypothetical protein
MSSVKEVAHAFRWYRAFLKHKQPSVTKDATARYTNFSLQHAWEKFDCQTQLLQREALVPLMKRNPEVLDADLDRFGAVYFDIKRPAGPIAE